MLINFSSSLLNMEYYKGKLVPKGFECDVNYHAFRDMEEAGQLEKFAGQYLAFVNGQHVLTETTNESALQKLRASYPDKRAFINYVPLPGEKIPVVRFRSPRVVRNSGVVN